MDNIYSAYHYACKTKADKEAIEQIYEEVKKTAQNAIYRNIGDIFFTARTDTEINGAVECNGGTYSTADFEGKQTVGNLLASGSLPYVSLSEYESLVSANGSCRAFGWDGGDSFRVPTIPALLLTKEQSAVVGNGMTLGLTNGSINFALSQGASSSQMMFVTNAYGKPVGTGTTNAPASPDKAIGVTTNPTKSGIVANLDVIEYRAMVQLASGATDQAVITATSALQQIANKVDRDEADYVVESYNDGSSWYRVWKSGWLEQGGSASGAGTITFLKPYRDSLYSISISAGTSTATYMSARTPTSFTLAGNHARWMAAGYIA